MNFYRLSRISLLIIQDVIPQHKKESDFISNSMKHLFQNIYVSKDPNDAIEVFKQNMDDIDIIILDIETSKKLDAIKTIRKLDEKISLLAFLYCDDVNLIKELLNLDIDAFLMKPVDANKLLLKLNKLVKNILSKKELESKKEIIDKNFIYSETDTRGIITYVSEPFIELSGYTKEELLGKSHNIIRHKDTKSSLFKELWITIKSGKTWMGEMKNQKKDGSFYIVKSVVTPMFYKKKIVGYCSARVDITRMYEKSKELHLRSKYKAMNEMLSMISHHWRQPIASIGLEVDNALFDITMDQIDKDSISTSLKNINERVQHLSGILNTFKSFIDKKPKEIVSIDLLMQNVVFVMRGPLEESNIEIYTNIADKNKSIFTYKSELINVLISIIINAKENIDKNSIQNANITIACEVSSKYLEIKIKDNGGGIDARIIESLFEPYISTKEMKNGTGLGLYIVKEVVEKKLNGSVSAKNLDDGAEFTLSIRGVINE